MNLELKKINDYEIQVPKIGSGKQVDWKGKKLFDIRYWLMGILGKKKSGKTSLIYSLIKYFVSKKMIVIFFASTFYIDDNYQVIREWLEKNEIVYMAFTNIIDEGVNNVDLWMKEHERKVENEEDEQSEPTEGINTGEQDEEEEEDEDEDKEPEFLFVFDDLSSELRDPAVRKLCKNMRHFKAKVILSTQSITDIHPHQYIQMDYVALFKGFNNEVLKDLFKKIEPQCDLPTFISMYRKIAVNYDFLLIDRAKGKFRKNLNEEIKI